ncbi:MAG: PD-(D/E)XK motif protein [Caldilineaceae bacterium]|nr:PD-(D/E)XK motif protein [Caldilineaceae bacterium]
MNNPWDNIRQPSKDVSARRVDHTHSLDLFWARDYLGHYLFIYEFPSEDVTFKINSPDLAGIQTFYLPADNSSTKNRLVLMLNEQSNWELFLSLCDDLVQATRQAETSASAVQIILRRLDRWHDFLKKNRNDLLAEEKIKGLIGELMFIKNHLIPVFGAGQAIQFWQGPEGLPQDFNVNSSAIEVKCQSGASSPYVQITSADQLCPQLPEMYLFVITLGKTLPETEFAIHLPGLVAHIRDALQSDASRQIERFNDLLHMVGYIDSDRYLEFSYIFSGEKMFEVTDGFPRICSSDIHHGIEKLSYNISLTACESFEGKPDWAGSTL